MLIGSVSVRMGKHLILLESQMQEAANQCVLNHIITKTKQSLSQFISTIESPLINALTQEYKEKTSTRAPEDNFEVVDAE